MTLGSWALQYSCVEISQRIQAVLNRSYGLAAEMKVLQFMNAIYFSYVYIAVLQINRSLPLSAAEFNISRRVTYGDIQL